MIFLKYFNLTEMKKFISAALVVGDTFRLGRARFFGSKRQHDKCYQVRQKVVQVAGEKCNVLAEFLEEIDAIAIDIDGCICCCKALQNAENKGYNCDVERFPVTKNHNSKC